MQFNREAELASQDIINFMDFFGGNIELTLRNKSKYERELKLQKAFEIYDSNLIEIRKIYELTKLYKSSKDLRRAFSKFNRYRDDEFLKGYCDKIEEMANYLEEKEEQDLVTRAKELVEQEEQLKDYGKAKECVIRYNKSDKIFLSDFLKEEEISKETFNNYKKMVENFDPIEMVYNREKDTANFRERRYFARSCIRDMYNGITTGFTRRHTKFDELECFNLLPYRSVENLNELLEDFGSKNAPSVQMKFRKLLEAVEPEKAATVYKYLIEHKIITNPLSTTTFDNIRKENVIINGRQVTPEEKETMITYMRIANTPLLCRAVTLVRNKVLNGEIKFEKNKELSLTK